MLLGQIIDAIPDSLWITLTTVCPACPMVALAIAWRWKGTRALRRFWLVVANYYLLVAFFYAIGDICVFMIPLAGGPIVAGGLVYYASKMSRFPPNHCTKCGYDLRGAVSDRCSECGTII